MDIKKPGILKLKGLLFLFLGLLSAAILYMLAPDWKVMVLLGICVWSFARFYYFAFYVLEKYADPEFRYAGLFDLLKYLLRGRQK